MLAAKDASRLSGPAPWLSAQASLLNSCRSSFARKLSCGGDGDAAEGRAPAAAGTAREGARSFFGVRRRSSADGSDTSRSDTRSDKGGRGEGSSVVSDDPLANATDHSRETTTVPSPRRNRVHPADLGAPLSDLEKQLASPAPAPISRAARRSHSNRSSRDYNVGDESGSGKT